MSQGFNPDTTNAPIGANTASHDSHRIVRKLGPVLAFMFAMTAGVVYCSRMWISQTNDTASATRDAATARAKENCHPITQQERTIGVDKIVSEKSDEVAVSPQAEKGPETVTAHNRSGHSEQAQSGAARRNLQLMGARRPRLRKPQFRDYSPTPSVYGSPSVADDKERPRFSIIPSRTLWIVKFPEGITKFAYPGSRDASAVGSYRR